MPDLSVDDLLAGLPRTGFRFPLVTETAELRYVPQPESLFVPPTLSGPTTGTGALILVEARAAVGKSTLAKHVAYATGSPLWDLSELYVGSGTLWGRLALGFGPRGFSEVIAAIAEGDFLLVIDALDEAELHAAGPSFDAFLTDLGQLFANSPGRPTALVFGRSETIEYLHLFLGPQAPVRRYTIEPFDQPSANTFLERYLENGPFPRSVQTAHQVRPTVFEEARGRLYRFFAEAISPNGTWASERVRGFLGYAPVLVALAEYLAAYSDNYQRLASDLEAYRATAQHSGAQWQLLTQLMRRLLQRENEKFLKQARQALVDRDWSGHGDLYTPDDQCSLILKRVSRRPHPAPTPADLPARLHDPYQKLVGVALPNHPFLGSSSGYANQVIRDYVHAWGLRLGSPDDRAALRQELGSTYLPSPLLARFFVNLEAAGPLTVDAEDFGLLYESFLAYRDEPLSIAGDDEFASALIGVEDDDPAVIVLENVRGGVQLRRRLSSARIRGVSVRLGLPGRTFSVGPDVRVECELLEVPSGVVQVYPRHGPVSLAAREGYVHLSRPEPEIVVFGEGGFEVWWDDIRYPWVQYQAAGPPDTGDQPVDRDVHAAFLSLCRLTRRFFPLKRTQRPFFGPATETNLRGAGSGPLGDYLVRERVIVNRGGAAFFNPVRFKAMGASLTEVHLRVLGPDTHRFLLRYLGSGGGGQAS